MAVVAPEADLLPVTQPQPARARQPGIDPALWPPATTPRDDPRLLVRAARLRPDLPQRQAFCQHSPRPYQRKIIGSPRLRAPVEHAQAGDACVLSR